MDSERWQHVSRVFEAALERPAEERSAFVAATCDGDEALRREVESLLAQEERHGPFDRPVYLPDALTADPAALSAGTDVGPYQVEAIIGGGGMGEVYRARDTQLGRLVALKVLPRPFASNPERLSRFQREAQTLATLNHPHIGAIYGIEHAGDVRALVLELVEGDTLADRIARGALPLEDALPIARQITGALQAAHERGVVHRDLKPSNIKISPDGVVKVLDFGLARLSQQDGVELTDATVSPTMASPPVITAAGMILGTAAYMAPEQAKGRPADTRGDIWAFGCVLFEMLTGARAFRGEDVAETLAAVLRSEPDFSALPASTPASIRSLVQKCLVKNPRERLQHIGDARFDLNETSDERPTAVKRERSARREWLAWAVAAVALAASGLLAYRASKPSQAEETHVELITSATSDPAGLALSPDGRTVAYVADGDAGAALRIRSLDSASERVLPNTQGAENPFWSPDGRAIGFFADQALKRIDVETGTVQMLARTSGGNRGGTWTRDNVILFIPTTGSPLYRISAAGGEATPIISPPFRNRGTLLESPHALPDGRRFLCFSANEDGYGAYIGDVDGSYLTHLVDSDSAPVVLSGQLLFVRGGALLTQAFDPDRRKVSGTPQKIADRVFVDTRAHAAIAVSSTGSLVYRSDVPEERRQFTWVNRKGALLQTVGEPLATSEASTPALSRDDTRVAFSLPSANAVGVRNIWMVDIARGVPNRLTDVLGEDTAPLWLPDNESIVFSRNVSQIVKKSVATFSSPEETLARTTWAPGTGKPVETDIVGIVTDVSSDGRYLLMRRPSDRGYNILGRDLRGGPTFSVVETSFDELDAQFAPNGRWIAYQSNKSGRFEIYLQPFRDSRKAEIRVSAAGGAQVRWRRDGSELFYVAPDGTLMAVPIQFGPGDDPVTPGVAVPLFRTNITKAPQSLARQQYMVASNGQRFLMNAVVAPPGTSPLKMILNWSPRQR